jgi:hypothetical protein
MADEEALAIEGPEAVDTPDRNPSEVVTGKFGLPMSVYESPNPVF